MLRPLIVAVLLVGCGGAASTSASATTGAPQASDGSILLVRGEAIRIPDTSITATLREVEPERPREELPQERAFVERELARAWLELAVGDTVERVRWHAGPNTFAGIALRLSIARDGSTRLGVDHDAR